MRDQCSVEQLSVGRGSVSVISESAGLSEGVSLVRKFCEIGVIGLIGVGSSSTLPGPTHNPEAEWSKTERRWSRLRRFRRSPRLG